MRRRSVAAKYGYIMKKIIFALLFTLSSLNLSSQLCEDYMIWDGSETVSDFGIDTTGNWWAITNPFSNYKRLIVSGDETEEYNQISKPIFSQDGNRWAAFAEYNGSWYVITNDDLIELKATDVGSLGFTNNSKYLVYSYKSSEIEYIVLPEQTIQVLGKAGTFYVNDDANMFAFAGMRGSKYVININGIETTTFDEVLPIGFWHDNTFIYAAKNGMNWQIYRNNRPISENYALIKETAINRFGTVAAAIIETFAGYQTAIVISDDYYEPIIGRNYDLAAYLTLHPDLPLVAYFAKSGLGNFIVQNTAEYSTYINTGVPQYSSDGEDLLFAACDFDCFVAVNGKRYTLKTSITPQNQLAIKSGSNTIAYSTSSNMNVLFLETNKMHAGMMVDKILPPIFNRRTNRYETVGAINNRLYLLTCRTN